VLQYISHLGGMTDCVERRDRGRAGHGSRVDLTEAFAAFDHWSPRIVARINDMELKVVK